MNKVATHKQSGRLLLHIVRRNNNCRDINHKKKWNRFFNAFGVNPLVLYIFAGVMASLFLYTSFNWQGEFNTITSFIYRVLFQSWASNYYASLLYARFFVSICCLFGYILYKRNIYIKI